MNPYEILGLQEGASAEQINLAYKEKMAFYSSADGDYFAQINALNEAYDSLMYQGQTTYQTQAASSVKFGDVRAKIREKRFEDAETILDGVPIAERNAEWYFLKGQIFQNRGWLEDAADCFEKAARLEPNNSEFQAAAQSVKNKRSGEFRDDWRQSTGEEGGCTSSLCKICTALACCDCLCSFCR